MTKKMVADEILVSMYKMDDTEKLELLKVLSEKHFDGRKSVEEIRHRNYIAMSGEEEEDNHCDSRTIGNVGTATMAYIEGYLQRKLTDEEIIIMKLAYDWGHFVGGRNGIKQVLKSNTKDEE